MATTRTRTRTRTRARAAPRPLIKPVETPETALDDEPQPQTPQIGELLPTLEDIEQVMLGVDEPSEITQGAGPALGQVSGDSGSLGPLSAWTTAEATRQGKNFVRVERAWGGQWTTVYDWQGNDHRMLKEDVPGVIGRDLEPHQRRYLRCPLCARMPNAGIHPIAGPNGCPARPKRLMTYCDVCAANGNARVIYEDHMPANPLQAPPVDTADPNYRAPAILSNKSREEGLQMKLDDHIRAFHINTARQRGLRRD